MRDRPTPTGVARTFPEDGLIVSKTDLAGNITYGNRLFMEVAGYSEEELLGAPHNLIRHPDMPRAVFAFLWDEIQAGREVFAYVVNLAKNGDHYWVLAHVTPSFDEKGELVGYHSTRRAPEPSAIEAVAPIYAELCAAEQAAGRGPAAIEAGMRRLSELLAEAGTSYEELVFSLAA